MANRGTDPEPNPEWLTRMCRASEARERGDDAEADRQGQLYKEAMRQQRRATGQLPGSVTYTPQKPNNGNKVGE